MANNFLNVIDTLNRAEPNEVLGKLHKMFSSISTMSADEVVAAYQTLKVAAKYLDKSNNQIVVDLVDAMESQMVMIAKQPGNEHQKKRFNNVIGRKLCKGFLD